jgi:hypothetical protein
MPMALGRGEMLSVEVSQNEYVEAIAIGSARSRLSRDIRRLLKTQEMGSPTSFGRHDKARLGGSNPELRLIIERFRVANGNRRVA